MRRVSMVLIAVLVLMFAVGSAFAGQACGAHKTTAATTTSCATMSHEDCAKICGISPEECKKLCGDNKNCSVMMIKVDGMTCGGCEKSLSEVLSKIEGVSRVVKVDHKEGIAVVCTVAGKVLPETLTTAITDKGYKAEIIPAVAKVTKTSAKGGCNPATCAATKKCCPTKTTKTDKTGKASGTR